MDKSQCKAIIDGHIKQLRFAMGLQSWKVSFIYDHCGGAAKDGFATRAHVVRRGEYYQASITVDPAEFNTQHEVLKALRHELLHLFHAEFDTYDQVVQRALSENGYAGLEPVRILAIERLVYCIESLLDYNGLTAEKLMDISRKRIARNDRERGWGKRPSQPKRAIKKKTKRKTRRART